MKNKIALLLLSGSVLIQACNHTEEKKKIDKSDKEPLQVMVVNKHKIGEEVQLPGILQPYEMVQIFPKVNGFVKNVYVDRGTNVKKGQRLLELEAPEMLQSLAAARLKLVESQSMYETSKERYDRLMETNKTPGAVSPYDLSAAKSKMNAALATMQAVEANYKAQQAMNNYLSISAPFDGIITERNVHPGALVGMGSNSKPMLVIQQQSKLRLVVSIPEQYSSQMSSNEVKYTVNALPGETFRGAIARSSGYLNDNYRTETVEIDVPNPTHKLKAGMYAEVLLPEDGNVQAFVVPKTAIVTTTEKKYVIALRNNRTQWLDVTQGNESDDSTEIFGALQAGDQVVVKASYEIKEGQAINKKTLAAK